MIPAEETFDGTWPYAPHFFNGNGFRQHYVDEGASNGEDGDVIVCLHGEPTWAYIYRNFIPRFSKLGRVIVPDHMGFGKSETPQDRDYWIHEHCDNLEQLLLSLDLRNITLVMQDWGGTIGTSFALRHPDRIRGICLCNTYSPWSSVPDKVYDRPWVNFIKSDHFKPTISNLGSTVLSVMKRVGFERTSHIDETWVRAYATPFPTVESSKGALQFPLSIGHPETITFVEEMAEKYDVDALKQIPAMCVVGMEDRGMPPDWLEYRFRDAWPGGPLVKLPGVGHYLQEDAPEAVSALIDQFIQINSPST
jgi:haloalkane dehalogenase